MSIIDWINGNPEAKKCMDELEEVHRMERAKHPERYSDNLKDSPMEITIKPEILDTSALKEDNSKDQFRPSKFSEYIGQLEAKETIVDYINGCKIFNDPFPHIFLSAPSGCGKTVFANIIANMLNKKFVKCGATDLKSEQQLVDKIVECNGGTLLIDESHKLSSKLGTFLLPILEERLIAGKKIKPFVCIMATTHKGNLSENLSALIQRFLSIDLEHYNKEDLKQILKQFAQKSYPKSITNDDILTEIVKNCKLTPRIAIKLLRHYIYTNNLEKVKRSNKIVKEGLTKIDIKVLKYLDEHNGVGMKSIAKYLNVEPKTYEFEIEPYLILKELISVCNRRKITNKGKEFLKEIKNG
jgi:Holliday junction DNA helicase RuvB